jgi:hypothetical protein
VLSFRPLDKAFVAFGIHTASSSSVQINYTMATTGKLLPPLLVLFVTALAAAVLLHSVEADPPPCPPGTCPPNPSLPDCCLVQGCHAICTNFLSDSRFCGRCNMTCNQYTDPPTNDCCNGVCKDTQTDPKNCGTCGHKCSAKKMCSTGKCTTT